jgi:hypothetical protein
VFGEQAAVGGLVDRRALGMHHRQGAGSSRGFQEPEHAGVGDPVHEDLHRGRQSLVECLR